MSTHDNNDPLIILRREQAIHVREQSAFSRTITKQLARIEAEREQLYRELAQTRVLLRWDYEGEENGVLHPEAGEGVLVMQHHFVYTPRVINDTRGLYDRPSKGTASPHRCAQCGKVIDLPYATAYTEFGALLKHVAFDEPCPTEQAKLDASIADEITALRARITRQDLDKQRAVADHQHESSDPQSA